MLRALFRSLRRCLFLISNTLSCFIHCNSSRFLVFVMEVRSRRRQPSSPKIIQLLSPNPDQLVCFNRKANSKGSAPATAYLTIDVIFMIYLARRVASVQLGKRCFNAVTTGVHKAQIFPGEDGLLGNALLSKFRLTIDQPGNRVILENPAI